MSVFFRAKGKVEEMTGHSKKIDQKVPKTWNDEWSKYNQLLGLKNLIYFKKNVKSILRPILYPDNLDFWISTLKTYIVYNYVVI